MVQLRLLGIKLAFFKDYFDLLTATAAQWAAHQKSLESAASFHDISDDYQELAVSADGGSSH
jgi:hypothetical protein